MNANNYKEKTEKTMELLEALPKVKSSAYFQTRVEASIELLNTNKVYSFNLNTALRYAFFIMIIVLNIGVSYSYLKSNNNSKETRESMIQELSGTFFTNSTDNYSLTNQ